MSNILYLVHRIPFPPNKGDKVRSYHLLKHLAAQHRVFLGTFMDDPEDEIHIETLKGICAEVHVSTLSPKFARLRSLNGLLSDDPLTIRYYRDASFQSWVEKTCATRRIDTAVVFSSAMAQYVEHIARLPTLVDFVDVDSAKWTQYAQNHRWPLSWVYRREGQTLLRYEKQIAMEAARSFFVTDAEAALFSRLAPECAVRVEAMCNGVDAEFFEPSDRHPSPFDPDELPVVFTGAMDYWPNIDAVAWFANDVVPLLRKQWPTLRFYIVGRSPVPAVQALANDAIVVTGTVPDVRPYLQHAQTVVAPLRLARGIQNKILEAMAMARPVVASPSCVSPIDAVSGQDLVVAETAEDYCKQIGTLLAAPSLANAIGVAARTRVMERYSWEANLSRIDPYLNHPSGHDTGRVIAQPSR